MRKIVLALFLTLLLAGCSNTYKVKVEWEKPKTGGPISHYIVEYNRDGIWSITQTEETTIILYFYYDVPCFVRVVAVSPEGQKGPYSQNSDTLTVSKRP